MRVVAIVAAVGCAGCGRFAFDARNDGGDVGTSPFIIQIEAESGFIVPPFRVEQDTMNPSIFFVVDGNTHGLSGGGSVSFTVKIPSLRSYYLWTRSRPFDETEDSFMMSLDGSPPVDFWTGDCVYGVDWHWNRWRNNNVQCPALGPTIGIDFTAGDRSIVFTSREGDSMLDQLLLTDDESYVPN